MSDEEIRKKKASRAQTSMAVWVLLAMLVTGLGGFGVTNFGNSVTAVGSVGEVDVEANAYARALRSQVNRMSQQFGQQLTLEEAKMFGVDQQVLSALLGNAALDNEALRLGLSVGDATLAQKLALEEAFKDVTGTFNADTYKKMLEQVGTTPREYEAGLRADIARSVLQASVVGGTKAPSALSQTLLAWSGETRGFSLVQFSESTLPVKPAEPTDADLKAHYDTNIDAFTRGEAKRITYVALRPADLAPAQVIEEKAVEDLYNARLAEFVIPEKRLVERLVYPTDAEAQAAKAKLDGGASFETLASDRQLGLDDIDLGEVTKSELGAAGEAVFALTEPGVVGPLASDLGPALYRMNGILPAIETTLDQARPALTSELQAKAAGAAVADQGPAIDDALAGGATLEDLARDYGMVMATIDFVPDADDNDPVAADETFAAAAMELAEGDFPEALQLKDGSIAALRLDQIVPPSPVPLDQIRDRVAAEWTAAELAKALTAQAVEAETALKGGADLATLGTVVTIAPATRDARPEGTTPDVMSAAFAMTQGETRLLQTPGFTGLLRLDSITPMDPAAEAAVESRKALETRLRAGIAADAYDLYIKAMTSQGGLTIDQAVINAVQSQMQ